ncbi:hypothetical protein Pcinc_043427, partial [Petrolisthes cinctipes]
MASLLLYLVLTSGARQVTLLHDLSLPDVAGVVGVLERGWGGQVSVFLHPHHHHHHQEEKEEEENRDWLLEALQSPLPLQSLRQVVVVFCSFNHTLHIFSQVRERSLESVSLQWIIVVAEDAISRLLEELREGTQVAVAGRQEGEGSVYNLYSSFVAQDNNIRLKKVGLWQWERDKKMKKKPTSNSRNSSSPLSTPLLHPPLHALYADLGGRRLLTAVVDNWPYFRIRRDSDGTLQPDTGIDISLLNTLAYKLNFTYELVEVEDKQWGVVGVDGVWTGMVGKVVRHEAHFAINEITVTATREAVVDFTAPYFMEMTVLLSRAPAIKSRAFAVLTPFSTHVWLVLAASLPLMASLLTALSRVRDTFLCTPNTTTTSHAYTTTTNTTSTTKNTTKNASSTKQSHNSSSFTTTTTTTIAIPSVENAVSTMPLHASLSSNTSHGFSTMPLHASLSSTKPSHALASFMTTPPHPSSTTLGAFCFNLFRAFVNQDTRHLPKNLALRLGLFSWFFLCFMVY